jgi:hypothetical protein
MFAARPATSFGIHPLERRRRRCKGPCRSPVSPFDSSTMTRKSSPSRWRFRPLSPLTFGFRVEPSGCASSYSRSVLGAGRTLRDQLAGFKRRTAVISAKCGLSRTQLETETRPDETRVLALSPDGSSLSPGHSGRAEPYRSGHGRGARSRRAQGGLLPVLWQRVRRPGCEPAGLRAMRRAIRPRARCLPRFRRSLSRGCVGLAVTDCGRARAGRAQSIVVA